jgi:hypothetical protein
MSLMILPKMYVVLMDYYWFYLKWFQTLLRNSVSTYKTYFVCILFKRKSIASSVYTALDTETKKQVLDYHVNLQVQCA